MFNICHYLIYITLYFNRTPISPISHCTSYKYVVVEFDQNCALNSVNRNRTLNAQNAVFLIPNNFDTNSCTVNPLVSRLFSSKLFPILLYGDAIWGLMQEPNILYSSERNITSKDVLEKNFSNTSKNTTNLNYVSQHISPH